MNNFDKIKIIMFNTISDENDFFFFQILKRRKENPGMKKNTKLIRSYNINSIDELDKVMPSMITLAENNNARITCRVNKRNYTNIATKMLIELANRIDSKQYKNIDKLFDSIAGKYPANSPNKLWILDVDTPDMYMVNDIKSYITKLNSNVEYEFPSKSGMHIMVKPCS